MLLSRLSEQEKEAWEQIGQIMQDERRTNSEDVCVHKQVVEADDESPLYMSTIDDVLEQLARTEKGWIFRLIIQKVIITQYCVNVKPQ